MNQIKKVVGTIEFDGRRLNVYEDVNEPLFKATDVANMIGYSDGNTYRLLEKCEQDEKLLLPIVVGGQKRVVSFVTENGLYNILSQSRMPLARKWRRIIHDEIIRLRRERGLDIIAKFEEWDHELDTLYFDEETGILMQSVTVQGGDVEQVPYKFKEDE